MVSLSDRKFVVPGTWTFDDVVGSRYSNKRVKLYRHVHGALANQQTGYRKGRIFSDVTAGIRRRKQPTRPPVRQPVPDTPTDTSVPEVPVEPPVQPPVEPPVQPPVEPPIVVPPIIEDIATTDDPPDQEPPIIEDPIDIIDKPDDPSIDDVVSVDGDVPVDPDVGNDDDFINEFDPDEEDDIFRDDLNSDYGVNEDDEDDPDDDGEWDFTSGDGVDDDGDGDIDNTDLIGAIEDTITDEMKDMGDEVKKFIGSMPIVEEAKFISDTMFDLDKEGRILLSDGSIDYDTIIKRLAKSELMVGAGMTVFMGVRSLFKKFLQTQITQAFRSGGAGAESIATRVLTPLLQGVTRMGKYVYNFLSGKVADSVLGRGFKNVIGNLKSMLSPEKLEELMSGMWTKLGGLRNMFGSTANQGYTAVRTTVNNWLDKPTEMKFFVELELTEPGEELGEELGEGLGEELGEGLGEELGEGLGEELGEGLGDGLLDAIGDGAVDAGGEALTEAEIRQLVSENGLQILDYVAGTQGSAVVEDVLVEEGTSLLADVGTDLAEVALGEVAAETVTAAVVGTSMEAMLATMSSVALPVVGVVAMIGVGIWQIVSGINQIKKEKEKATKFLDAYKHTYPVYQEHSRSQLMKLESMLSAEERQILENEYKDYTPGGVLAKVGPGFMSYLEMRAKFPKARWPHFKNAMKWYETRSPFYNVPKKGGPALNLLGQEMPQSQSEAEFMFGDWMKFWAADKKDPVRVKYGVETHDFMNGYLEDYYKEEVARLKEIIRKERRRKLMEDLNDSGVREVRADGTVVNDRSKVM